MDQDDDDRVAASLAAVQRTLHAGLDKSRALGHTLVWVGPASRRSRRRSRPSCARSARCGPSSPRWGPTSMRVHIVHTLEVVGGGGYGAVVCISLEVVIDGAHELPALASHLSGKRVDEADRVAELSLLPDVEQPLQLPEQMHGLQARQQQCPRPETFAATFFLGFVAPRGPRWPPAMSSSRAWSTRSSQGSGLESTGMASRPTAAVARMRAASSAISLWTWCMRTTMVQDGGHLGLQGARQEVDRDVFKVFLLCVRVLKVLKMLDAVRGLELPLLAAGAVVGDLPGYLAVLARIEEARRFLSEEIPSANFIHGDAICSNAQFKTAEQESYRVRWDVSSCLDWYRHYLCCSRGG